MIFLIVRYNESRSWSCPDYTDYSVKKSRFPDYTDYTDYADYRLQITWPCHLCLLTIPGFFFFPKTKNINFSEMTVSNFFITLSNPMVVVAESILNSYKLPR